MRFITNEEEKNQLFSSSEYYIGEYHETISVEMTFEIDRICTSAWGTDVTDKLPCIRDFDGCQVSLMKSLSDTVITGELLIPKVSITDMRIILKSGVDACLKFQEQHGKFYVRANDIRYFKGIKIEQMPFHRRKEYLQRVIDQLQSPHIKMFEWHEGNILSTEEMFDYVSGHQDGIQIDYPVLADDFYFYRSDEDYPQFSLSFKRYYEYLCMRGNRQGVIFKSKNGKFGEECFVVMCDDCKDSLPF